jgi:hypothetical protein
VDEMINRDDIKTYTEQEYNTLRENLKAAEDCLRWYEARLDNQYRLTMILKGLCRAGKGTQEFDVWLELAKEYIGEQG